MRGCEIAGLVLVLGLGCADGPGASSSSFVEVEGETLYVMGPGLCFSACPVWTLYRDAELVELLAYGLGDTTVTSGELSPEAAAQIDEQLAALDEAHRAGEIDLSEADCHYADAPFIELVLPSDTLQYGDGCEPEAVLELDALLRSLTEDLARCQASERIAPSPGCEPLVD